MKITASSLPIQEAAHSGRLGRLEHFVCSDEDPHEEIGLEAIRHEQ